MKFLVLCLSTFFSLSAQARDIYLQDGESVRVQGTNIYCGGGQTREPWMCACFTPSGRNVGVVEVMAFDKTSAVYDATPECKRTFRDYSLKALSIGCNPSP